MTSPDSERSAEIGETMRSSMIDLQRLYGSEDEALPSVAEAIIHSAEAYMAPPGVFGILLHHVGYNPESEDVWRKALMSERETDRGNNFLPASDHVRVYVRARDSKQPAREHQLRPEGKRPSVGTPHWDIVSVDPLGFLTQVYVDLRHQGYDVSLTNFVEEPNSPVGMVRAEDTEHHVYIVMARKEWWDIPIATRENPYAAIY